MTNKMNQPIEQLERRILWAGGDLDTSFGTGGVVRDNVGSYASPDNVRDVGVDAQGRIYAVGTISDGAEYGTVLRRYLPGGAIDTSFGGGDGKVNLGIVDSMSDSIYALAIQDDGKVVLVGQHAYNTRPPGVWAINHQDFGVWRFNEDGSVDTTFGGGDGIANADFDDLSEAYAVEIMANGKIVVFGQTRETYDPNESNDHWTDDGTGVSTTQMALARFNADGSLDSSFSGDGKLLYRFSTTATYGWDVDVQGDGKVVVGGTSIIYGETNTVRTLLLRFNANGSADSSFGSDGVVSGSAMGHMPGYRTLEIDAQGRIVVGGADETSRVIARYNANGSLDTSFGTAGIVRAGSGNPVSDLVFDADGNMLVTAGGGLMRFSPAGQQDTAFGNNGVAKAFGIGGDRIAVQADGKIIVSGGWFDETGQSDFVLLRYEGGAGDDNDPAPPPPAIDTNVMGPTVIMDGVSGEANILATVSGQTYLLPKPSADGSMNIKGSDIADTITAERVLALGAVVTDQYQLAYYNTSVGVIGLNVAIAGDPAAFQRQRDGELFNLTQAQETLNGLVATNASESEITRAKRTVSRAKDSVARIEALAVAMAATTSYNVFRLEGVYEIYVSNTVPLGPKARIRIDAAGGNDVVAISNNITMKATLEGGWGADKLTSGKRRSILSGGGGGDRLFSRSKVGCILDGGQGADRYWNRFGEVEIMARNDGDRLVIDDQTVAISTPGLFGHSGEAGSAGRCYYLTQGDEGQTDLLAV